MGREHILAGSCVCTLAIRDEDPMKDLIVLKNKVLSIYSIFTRSESGVIIQFIKQHYQIRAGLEENRYWKGKTAKMG